jgi:hypothetical protein
MDVIEALEQKRRELHELEERRGQLAKEHAAIEARMADVQAQISDAEEDERVLRRVAAQYSLPVPQDGPLLPREVEEWRNLARTAAVQRVLAESDRPLSPLGISQVLHQKGRNDSAHNVSAALARLKDTQRAKQADRGRWVVPGDPKQAEPVSVAAERLPTGTELIERQPEGAAIEEIEG